MGTKDGIDHECLRTEYCDNKLNEYTARQTGGNDRNPLKHKFSAIFVVRTLHEYNFPSSFRVIKKKLQIFFICYFINLIANTDL